MNVNINSESNKTQQQVVSFADQNEQWTYSIATQLDSAHRTVDSDDATLSNFFSRPIKIASVNWTVGSIFGLSLNPWREYFENDRVINRLSNYNVLRADLCVRILINGNGFHYGRALASYIPLPNQDQLVKWRYSLVNQDIIGASQRMHVWIDPTKSQGGTLRLPYVYYKNGMNIPEEDWDEMGQLDIASITTLEHANGGSDSVTISIFAWAENVSLSIPTVAEPGALTPQAADDEYEDVSKGPISGPAGTIAQVAGSLSAIPSIAPMALATQTAANAVGGVARAFGMSRPTDIDTISSYKPTYAGNFANTNVSDTSVKLTLDAKQELTIDPSAVGLGNADEMAISSIACRESYIHQFPWSPSDTPETLLWNTYVTPMMLNTAQFQGETEYHLTPSAYVALPFENWRGSMKYRFQIVASAFHKGRLKIVYDPYFNSTSEYNTQQTHIIDLAYERDFTVTVNWGQELSFLDHSDDLAQPFSRNPLGGARHESSNGILAVYVVNDLTTPSATLDPVTVLVSSSAGEDFEVCNPNGENIRFLTFFQPQSDDDDFVEFEPQALDVADGDLTTQETAPVSDLTEHEFATANSVAEVYKIYFGDPVTSVRQLLKRYTRTRAFAPYFPGTGSEGVYAGVQTSNFPMYRGYDPNGYDNAAIPSDPTPYTYGNMTPLHWFTPLFLARRGGMRIKYVYSLQQKVRVNGIMSVERITENGATRIPTIAYQTRDLTSSSANTWAAQNFGGGDFSGSQVTPLASNPVLEVELPFASRYRFFPARKLNLREAGSEFTQQHEVKFPCIDEGYSSVQQYASVGEDFSLNFFQSCPVCWRVTVPAPSTSN